MSVTFQPKEFSRQKTYRGLTTDEVAERVRRGEVNAFEARVGRTTWQIIRHNLLNVFNILLFVLLLIVLFSQDYATVFFAGFSVLTTSIMGTVQELNAKRKLDKLASISAQRVKVWRDGDLVTVSDHEVVKDDKIAIEPGDRIAVDGEIIDSDSLEIDESHLTGESDAVYKSVEDRVYSGSFCIAGKGVMVATQVGRQSTVNRLSAIAKVYKNTLTPTQYRIATIVKLALLILFVMGPMVMINGYVNGIPFLDVVRNTVVFVTSLVAQGLILTVILALTVGAVKMSRHQTLIQRINAVESMANVSVLCFDKTGTMTLNRLSVTKIIPLGGHTEQAIEDDLWVYTNNLSVKNSTAGAIARRVWRDDRPRRIPRKQREIPFNSRRKWGAIVLSDETLVLGAPERILGETHDYMEPVRRLSRRGLRVLVFARSRTLLEDESIAGSVEPLALIVISDQIRDDIRSTLQAFRTLGVGLKVISGDNLETVRAIAQRAGLATDVCYTGNQIKQMDDAELVQVVQSADVFARVEPTTKRRIIHALKESGEYVAMVGDGVNDVPALKEANLAIAMNDGAQISKDVADIVLLNNAMSTLPLAFNQGVEITQTIYGTAKMFLTKNMFNTLLFIFVLLMSLPFPITPVQISWAAFGTVNVPAGLMALGVVRPKFIKSFRDDVIDYILTSGFIGSVGLAIVYLITYAYTNGDVNIARSAVTTFAILYGLMVAWHIFGIDLLHPRTILQGLRGFVVTSVLTGGAVFVASLMPEIFEFWWPPAEIMALIVSMFALCLMIASISIRERVLLNRIYTLLKR